MYGDSFRRPFTIVGYSVIAWLYSQYLSMGIQGLFCFIRNHHNKQEFIHQLSSKLSADCVLIIDGPSLVHQFHEHLGLDSLCGGQYEEFYQGLVEFFSALRQDCPRLRVLMLLDEVTEEEKFEVVKLRKLDKLKRWVKAIELAQSSSLIPLCAWDVFKEAVKFCGIQTLRYDSEADDFISALAVHYTQQKIPAFILSQDTDFFFTVGVAGVLSIEDIVWSPGSRTRPVMEESKFFSLDDFLNTKHECYEVWMLPFIAIISGNDLTPPELKTAMEPIKTEFSSQGRGHFFSKLALHLRSLSRCTQTDEDIDEDTIASIKSKLNPEMCALFDNTYKRTKAKYLNPLANSPEDVPTPQLERMKQLYPGLCQESLFRISGLWSNKIGPRSKAYSYAEDYRQPRASLASLALRSYWHGVILLPTQEDTGVPRPTHVVEICRRRSGALYAGDTDTLGNVITDDEKLPIFYSVGGRCLPSLLQIQELSRGDKLQFFRSVMHCSDCQVLFSGTEFINYEVSVIIATLYYWFHEISFREKRVPSNATCISIFQRRQLLRILLNSALAVYFNIQLIFSILKAPNLESVTRNHFYHSVAEWLCIQNDTTMLLTVLDLPTVPIRRSYNGYLLFRMITDAEYCLTVSSQLKSLMREELQNIFEALLTHYSG